MVSVWWLAIDRNAGHASFEELKRRKVIAQGWPDLGDMTQFVAECQRAEPEIVKRKLVDRLREAYPGDEVSARLPSALYNFFFGIQPGDLVVGIEGFAVRGICEISDECLYSFEATTRDGREQNYAHGRGPVVWFSWEEFSPDWTPSEAGQTKAVAGLRGDARDEIIKRFASEGWQETMHLLSSPKNAERLRRSIGQMEQGEDMPAPLESVAIG